MSQKPPADAQPLFQITKTLEDQGYTLTEIEYEDNKWKVEGYSQGVEEVEFAVDPVTGEIED